MEKVSIKRLVAFLFCLPVLFLLSQSQAEAIHPGKIVLVKNINPLDLGGSYPEPFLTYNEELYFTAEDTYGNRELWKTDGSEAGTVLLKDINNNSTTSSVVNSLIVYNGKIFFWANDGIHNREIWTTDGSTDGTVLFKDINPTGSSLGGNPIVYNGKLYFTADDGTNGKELWVTDGNPLNTNMVININPTGDGSPYNKTLLNGYLYFTADDGTGLAFWKTDGTLTTKEFALSDKSLSSINFLTNVNGTTLFFRADDGTNGMELWKSDGTADGTMMVKDINPSGSSFPYYSGQVKWPSKQEFLPLNGKVYFIASDYTYGEQLWTSDGTSEGTVRLTDNGLCCNGPYALTAFNNKVFFNGFDSLHGYALWETDGTTAGTKIFLEKNKGIYLGLIDVNGILYFNAKDPVLGSSIWKTDGTKEGTVFVDALPSDTGADRLHNSNGTLYFMNGNPPSIGQELFKVTDLPEIFSDYFEGGDLSAWSSKTGSIVALNKAAMKGSNFGAAVKILNKKPKFLLDNSPNFETLYNARFSLDINSLKMGNNNKFTLFQGKMGKKTPFLLTVRKYNNKYWIRVSIKTDAGKMVHTKWKGLPNNPTSIEIGWKRADSTILRNGYIKLWINGVQTAGAININNDTFSITHVKIGVTNPIKASDAISGKFFIDSFDSNNQKFIGP